MKYSEAYLFIGFCLSLLVRSDRLSTFVAKFKSDRMNWPLIVTISSRQMVTPALFSSFKAHGLEGVLDPEIRNYLSIIHQLNLERNETILKEVYQLVSRLNEIGVQPTLIKGAAHLASGLYKDPGARIMSDIDILVPESLLMTCVEKLKSIGYDSKKPFDGELRSHHFPRLFHPNRGAGVEVHRWPTHKNEIKAKDVLQESSLWDVNGKQFRIPSREHSVMIDILHAHTGSYRFFPGQVNLRASMDYALLTQAPNENVVWERIFSVLYAVKGKESMEAFMDTTHWLIATPLPFSSRKCMRVNLSRLARKACVNSRHFERGILLTLLLINHAKFLSLRFVDLDVNEILKRLTSLEKWQNQISTLQNGIRSI